MTRFLQYHDPLTLENLESNMVRIEGGEYVIGNKEKYDEFYREPHRIKLKTFELCRYLVSQSLWTAVMGKNPSEFRTPNRPVEQVSWVDCQRFLESINQNRSIPFRLPKEAEWEYAARGRKSRAHMYSGSPNIKEVAIYKDNSQNVSQPSGHKLPNELGLFDMSGNLWEWCQDEHGTYPDASQKTEPLYIPQEPPKSEFRRNLMPRRSIRGGIWFNFEGKSHISDYSYPYLFTRSYSLGFRLARTL